MERKYDLKRLRRAVQVADVLTSYGLETNLVERHGELVGPCPLPEHQGDRSNRGAFRVRLSDGVWHCQTHCGGGDIVQLVAVMEGGDYAAAARRLALLDAGAQPALRQHSRALWEASPGSSFRPYAKSLRLLPDHAHVRARGIQPRTAKAFEAGWWPLGGFLEGCIGVRLHDPQGCPIGYAGRRVAQQTVPRLGKWKLPRALPKSDLLFNWHRARPFLQRGVVVVEGPFDAMRIWQAGFPAVVALLGCTATPSQQAMLATAPTVIVLLDGDAAGRHGARTIARALTPLPVQVVNLQNGRDPADLPEEDIRRILTPLSAEPASCS